MSVAPLMGEHDTEKRKSAFSLVVLWLSVSGLWSAATFLRVERVWVPITGWDEVLEGPWLWLSLLIPPVMFAVILLSIHEIRKDRG
jgi:hypothetical protein